MLSYSILSDTLSSQRLCLTFFFFSLCPWELPQVWGQGRQTGGATPSPRNGGCGGAGRPRGAIPHSRSGGLAVRRYPSSKVRSSSCTLLEQLWRDTPCPGKRNPSKMVGIARGHQREDTLKPCSQKTSQSNHTRTTVLSNSMKLCPCPCPWGHPRWVGHGGEVWQNVVRWRREWQTTSVFLPWEPHEQ